AASDHGYHGALPRLKIDHAGADLKACLMMTARQRIVALTVLAVLPSTVRMISTSPRPASERDNRTLTWSSPAKPGAASAKTTSRPAPRMAQLTAESALRNLMPVP